MTHDIPKSEGSEAESSRTGHLEERRAAKWHHCSRLTPDRRGVSPIIATVLMVSITVVLAGVLYAAISGFAGVSEAPPIVIFNEPVLTTSGTWLFDIVAVDSPRAITGFAASLHGNNSILLEKATLQIGAIASSGSLIMKFIDVTGDGKVSAGDYLTLAGADSTTDYRLTLYWMATGDRVGSAEVVR